MSQTVAPVANGYKVFGGSTAQWAATNDRLKYREMGVEYTQDGLVLIKFGVKTEGDVGTPWSELPYSSGPAGPSPAVEWNGTRLRVKNTDGTWTDWVNLQGPSVDYMWTGTSLKLKKPDGTWGDPVDLRGEPGPEGTSVPATPSSLGGVMPRTGFAVNADGYLDQDIGWSKDRCYLTPILVLHRGDVYKWLDKNGLGTAAGLKEPGKAGSEKFWSRVSGDKRGQVAPYYKVTFGGSDGRRPIFWGETEPDENYVLCDGGSDGAGGTVPDMRDRMILGASDKHPAGSTGGSETHDHSLSGTVGATTLSVEQLTWHNHAYIGSQGLYPSADGIISGGTGNVGTGYVQSTGGSQPHTHSLAASTGTANNLSPYYALAYVMRIA
ncbi:hypothetical protein [uncultured Desulfovibrio sp.]|uniref:hypothetical protein n=1 Tax=uncultured Desulfovibrio sp. TaxID=167968 RepID=UPI0025881354|nr:hypothetical protein [uncultured Desulfovibrio sp.]